MEAVPSATHDAGRHARTAAGAASRSPSPPGVCGGYGGLVLQPTCAAGIATALNGLARVLGTGTRGRWGDASWGQGRRGKGAGGSYPSQPIRRAVVATAVAAAVAALARCSALRLDSLLLGVPIERRMRFQKRLAVDFCDDHHRRSSPHTDMPLCGV